MKRLALFVAIVAVAVLVPATHGLLAKPANKVDVCHLNSSNQPGVIQEDVAYFEIWGGYEYSYSYSLTSTYFVGRVISVDESAVPAHVAGGDSTWFYALDEYTADALTSLEDWQDYYYDWYWDDMNYGWYSVDYTNTNAVITNANCYFYTATYGG
jgi:hypothetical protein